MEASSIWKPVRNRSIVDLVSILDRVEVHLGSIWDRFGFRLGSIWNMFGSMLRSGSDSSPRTPRDQISRPIEPILESLLDHMLAPCFRQSSVLRRPWLIFGQHGA